MAQCDCSLKHTNGGVCNCLDNNPLPDWDNFDEEVEEIEEEEEWDNTRITKRDDDWFVQ